MRVLLGVVSLLLALGAVALVAKTQLGAAATVGGQLPSATESARRAGASATPVASGDRVSGTSSTSVAEGAAQQVRDTTMRALQQGADRHDAEPR